MRYELKKNNGQRLRVQFYLSSGVGYLSKNPSKLRVYMLTPCGLSKTCIQVIPCDPILPPPKHILIEVSESKV